MLNKRTSPRRKMALPVKVTLDKVKHLAHTVDIVRTGACLGGFRTQFHLAIACRKNYTLQNPDFCGSPDFRGFGG
jgi:hypothetical protein